MVHYKLFSKTKGVLALLRAKMRIPQGVHSRGLLRPELQAFLLWLLAVDQVAAPVITFAAVVIKVALEAVVAV